MKRTRALLEKNTPVPACLGDGQIKLLLCFAA